MLLYVLSFSACNSEAQMTDFRTDESNFFETYVYLPMQVSLPETRELGQSVWSIGERIYDAHIGRNSFFVTSSLTDGSDVIEKEILLPNTFTTDHIEQIFLFGNGYLLFTVWGNLEPTLYSLNVDDGTIREWSTNSRLQDVVILQDSRMAALFESENGFILRTMDFSSGDWGEQFYLPVSNIINLLSPWEGAPFDFLFNDGNNIFAHQLETGRYFALLDWFEIGLVDSWNTQMGALSGGYLWVLIRNWVEEEANWNTELFLLSPTPRSQLPQRTVITLGGMWLSPDIRQAVANFNRESLTHQIQIKDYTEHDWQAGFIRLRTELMTGGGPDIIYNAEDILVDRGLLLDLYSFIDADSEINRTDFFQNVLAVLEGADGTLPRIGYCFSIHTMIGLADISEQIDTWTFSDFLSLVENASDITHLLGTGIRGERNMFLREALMYAGSELIDWQTGIANLDSDAFRNLLEIANHLPSTQDNTMLSEYVSEYARILRREQLLSVSFIANPARYLEISTALGEIVALGMPTDTGGNHVIQINGSMGINAATDRADDAWVFLREFLLPSSDSGWGFPLRIDCYERKIQELSTPHMKTDEDGNLVEIPFQEILFGDGFSVSIFAMTKAQADSLREMVERAGSMGRFDQGLFDIVQEEVLPFFMGDRTVQETARIIQSRVQIYLSEVLR